MSSHFEDHRVRLTKFESKAVATRMHVAFADFRKMAHRAEDFQLIVRAMQTVNDFQSSQFLNIACRSTTELSPACAAAIGRWGMRMTMILVEDAVKLIQEIKGNAVFTPVMTEPGVRRLFKDVKPVLDGGVDGPKRIRLIKELRNSAAAHLDRRGKVVDAIKFLGQRRGHTSRVEYSSRQCETRFFAAEEVLNAIVARDLWGVTGSNEDQTQALDDILDWCSDTSEAILKFLLEFVDRSMHHFQLWA